MVRLIFNYTPVACGAVRVFGSHCRISRVKAINWGTKTFKEGCFVFSIIAASAETTDGSGQPVMQETTASGIEDCVAVQPVNSARETTVLHIGGRKNPTSQAQAFGTGAFIRRNFVDGAPAPDPNVTLPPPNGLPIGSGPGTSTTSDLGQPTALFVGRRPHNRAADARLRFSNPRDPASKWNGYFLAWGWPTEQSTYVDLTDSQGTTDDSNLVIMGAEIRGIAVSSCQGAVVEQNQIHNCWIGGPYQSPLDDSVSQPTTPPTLAREERLDPLNALNTRSLIVRNNHYRNVAVGPYWNMGGVSAAVPSNNISYDLNTGLVTVTTSGGKYHKLWRNVRVKIESAPNTAYEGIREVSEVTNTTFKFALAPGLTNMPSGTASYRVVSGVDYLTIDGNVIGLADLAETEFGIKEYPLATNAGAQTFRAFGIVVGDNGLSAPSGPYAHRQVFIRNNKIRYVDGQKASTVAGLGVPAGAGMMLSGIKQLHVAHNVVDVNVAAGQKLRTFRIGTARFFHNTRPDGEVISQRYDEPETLAEDAFILSLFERRGT